MHNSNDRGVLENEFAHWMQQTGIYNDRTIDSRRSNARTIEKYYGLLIDQWKKDGFASLYREVSYSKHDELIGRPNPSKIPIDVSFTHLTLPTNREGEVSVCGGSL